MELKIDLTTPNILLKQGHLKMGGTGKNGESMEVCNRYIIYNEKPWIPIMGEIHYARYPKNDWELEILKMKACGINVISTYLFWIHHEEEEGQFDFSGDRDVKEFIEICHKHKMKVMIRIGPWCHGEVRNGGFPDWILSKCEIRTNDSVYLQYVRKVYQAYYNQLKELFFKEGGPIIGVQIENELVDNPNHLLTLKNLALEIGFDLPLYTVTAWGVNGVANFPQYEFLPLFGGYPEAPWRPNTDPFERKPHYLFAPGRNDITIGNDQIRSFSSNSNEKDMEDYPHAYCEAGPGIQATYHRRPIIEACDVYTIALVMLGKGNNLPGYYVFHGGRNPKGKLGTYQESKDTGYPNDLPVSSYDFQAPIGEYGFVKESYDYYKVLHLFLETYGETFAKTQVKYPNSSLTGKKDCLTPRCVMRVDENDSGYIFFNTNQRNYEISGISDLTLEIKGHNKIYTVPRKPLDIPTKKSFLMPFNQLVGNKKMLYATVQPITHIQNEDEIVYFYTAIDGVDIAFEFEGELKELSTTGVVKQVGDNTLISDIAPKTAPCICFMSDDKKIKIMVLKFLDALKLNKVKLKNKEYIILTSAHLYQTEDNISIYGEAHKDKLSLQIYPNQPVAKGEKSGENGLFTEYSLPIQVGKVECVLEEVPLAINETNKYYHYLFEENNDLTKEYLLTVHKKEVGDMHNIKILLDIEGNVMQIYDEQELVGDFFNLGDLVEIGTRRFDALIAQGKPLRIKLSPYGAKEQIFLERKIERDTVSVSIDSVHIHYELKDIF